MYNFFSNSEGLVKTKYNIIKEGYIRKDENPVILKCLLSCLRTKEIPTLDGEQITNINEIINKTLKSLN